MSDDIKKLEEHLVALEAFMTSPAYIGYQNALAKEIIDTQNRILITPPIDDKSRADCLMAHGELDCLVESMKRFEDARTTLKDRISEMTERDNESAAERKI